MNEPVLVDTSVWVDHFRNGNECLAGLLEEERVMIHPFIFYELACGNIRNRSEVLALLRVLPSSGVVVMEEVLTFIDAHRLMGQGLGYGDIQVLASAVISDVRLWTLDDSLSEIARTLGICFRDKQ